MDVQLTIGKIVITQTASGEAQLTSSQKADLSLLYLSYHKKVYQPGMVLAKLLLSNNSVDAATVIDFFSGKSIQLTRGTSDVIASDYYVYKVLPEHRRVEAKYYSTVTLYCYSRDHLLTLDSYCMTYVNKKLIGTTADDGIIQSELAKTGILGKAGFQHTADSATDTIDWDLRFLNYVSSADASGKATKWTEFIHPYLVQYNESFYDFLARTTNRCGEFLYHEGGKLHIGTPAVPSIGTSVRDVPQDKVLAYRYMGNQDTPVSPTHVYADDSDTKLLVKGKGMLAGSKKSYFYYDELPIDEYLGMFLHEDGFTSFGKEWVKDYWFILVDSLNILLNSSGWAQIGIKLASKFLATTVSAYMDSNSKNAEKNEKWITPVPEERKVTEDNGKATVSLYGSLLSTTQKQSNYEHHLNLNAKFYRFLDKCSQQVSSQLVEIEVGVGTSDNPMPAYSLGEVVTFEGKKYIVIEVKETAFDKTDADNESTMGQTIVLAPMIDAKVKAYDIKSNTYKEASAALSVFCPPKVVPFVRTSGAQRAFVAKRGDPEGLGRVCILYPWQTKEDSPSPWIRMTVPFAPNDTHNKQAGFFFEPMPGDEVLVDYEFGNIEHPFIVGSLYTRRTKAPKGDRCIESANGHTLSFNDHGSLGDFVAGIYPGYELMDKALVKIGEIAKKGLSLDDIGENFLGGLTLSDQWGIYKISCSATDRNISIRSPFGDVSLNAFTGISISAPNGDISIKGKNIDIVAGNEVKIVSGKFIDECKDTIGEKIEKGVANFVENLPVTAVEQVAPLTDLSFLRTCFEALFKPVVGTTSIIAGRYMLLNAGGGKAQIPNKGFSFTGLKGKEEDNEAKIKLTNTLRLLSTQIDTWLDTLAVKYKSITQAVAAYKEMFDYLEKPAAATLAVDLSKAASEIKDSDLKFATGCDAQDTEVNRANAVMALAMLRGMIIDIQNYCDEIKSGEGFGINKKDEQYYGKLLVELMNYTSTEMLPDIIANIIKKTEKFEQIPHTYIKNPTNKKMLHRMFAQRLVERTYILGQKPDESKREKKVKFESKSDYLDDAKWNKFIKLLAPNPVKDYFNRIGDPIKDLLTENLPNPIEWYDESKVWDTCKQGEVLISDKGGKETIHIENGVLTRTTNKDGFKDQIIETLRNI